MLGGAQTQHSKKSILLIVLITDSTNCTWKSLQTFSASYAIQDHKSCTTDNSVGNQSAFKLLRWANPESTAVNHHP